jgi:3-phosphoshikimate 1-carboxyvinyltransferase
MRVFIDRSKINGAIKAPRSKSHAIRLIFSSLLSPVEIIDLPNSEDVAASIRAIKALGVSVNGNRFELKGKPRITSEKLNVGGSATTLRMLLPIITVIGGRIQINGDNTLRRRPLDAIVDALKDRGVYISSSNVPVTIEGKLNDSWIRVRGSESSQYISGYMIAFCIRGYGEIYIDPPIVSKSYIYLTRDVLKDFGCITTLHDNKISVTRIEKPTLVRKKVEGDYALSSFYAASALSTNGVLKVYDLPEPKEYFGDHSIVNIYRYFGAYSEYSEGSWYVEATNEYRAIDINIDDAPDLGPSIAPIASIADGITRISGAKRLRIKESDRVETIISTLKSFDIEASFRGDILEIKGQPNRDLKKAFIDCRNDHRIAMMAAVLALRAGGIIENAECVNKSNPNFWTDLRSLGGKIKIGN